MYYLLCLLLPFASLYTLEPTRVMTISDAIVDFIVFVDDAFVEQIPGNRGGSSLVNHEEVLHLLELSPSTPKQIPGGSAVNMLKGLATLGHNCTLIVTIGEDDAGDFFLNRLKKNGLTLLLERSSIPTGKCVSLVTPNGERTMRTFLGGSAANAKRLLDSKDFENLSLFHIEGYQLQHRALIKEAIALAKQAGARISMDLASFETTRAHASFIWELLHSSQIDILFANKDEAKALTSLEPKQACHQLASYCPTVVVTLGEKGCLAEQKGELLWHSAFPVKAIDTTAAGDLFIGGFLSSYLKGNPLQQCMRTGSLLASHVVQVVGSEIPDESWEVIHEELRNSY